MGKKAVVESQGFLSDAHIRRSENMVDIDFKKNPLLKELAKLQKDWRAFMDEAEKIRDRLSEAHRLQDAAFKSGVPVVQVDLKDLDEAIPKLRFRHNEVMLAANALKEAMETEISAKYPET
jgi:predicted phage-related endonuclease